MQSKILDENPGEFTILSVKCTVTGLSLTEAKEELHR